MKKWLLSAVAYLIIVVGSYYAYTAVSGPPPDGAEHSNPEQHD